MSTTSSERILLPMCWSCGSRQYVSGCRGSLQQEAGRYIKIQLNVTIVTRLSHLHPWKFNLRSATNKIIWRNHKRGQAKVVIRAWNRRIFMVESNFKQICFEFLTDINWVRDYQGLIKQITGEVFDDFLWKVTVVSDYFTILGSWFKHFGGATEKTCFELCFRSKHLLENNNVKVLEICNKCRRLNKWLSWLVILFIQSTLVVF